MFPKRLLFFSLAVELLRNDVDCSCSFNQTVERGGTGTIRCSVSGSVAEHYWYQGSTLDSQPILRLENGNKGGTKYNDNHYDITTEGYMTIINAQIEHEAVYTFAVIFTNGSAWSQPISVSITVTPEPPCPLVTFCTGCDVCMRKGLSKTYTTLTCSIYEVRPKVALYWRDDDDRTLYNESRSEVINTLTDTWNFSSSITFEMDSCGEQKRIYCNVQNDAGMSSILNRTVIIHSEECHDWLTTVPFPETSEESPVMWISIVIVGVGLGIGLTVTAFIVLRRHCITTQGDHQSKSPRELEVRSGHFMNALMSRNTDTVLKELYRKDQLFGKGEEWYNINRRYRVTHYSDTNDETSELSDDISLLKTLESCTNNYLVLFVGKAGIGKTCLFRHILRRWSNDKILKDHVLIYLKLDKITGQMCLVEELAKMLSSRTKLTNENIRETLQNQSTIILIDGIKNLPISEPSNEVGHDNFNIWKLLTEKNEKFPTMTVWVTCREMDTQIKSMYNIGVKIVMEDFNRQDIVRNLGTFVECLKLSETAKLCQIWEKDKVCNEDQETDEIHAETPFVGTDNLSSKPPLENAILSTVIEHFNDIAGDEKGTFTGSLMSRLLVLIYLYSNNKEEFKMKGEAMFNFSSEKKDDVIDQFITYKYWEIVACLLEAWTENEEEFTRYAKMLHMKNIVFPLMNIGYHQQAVLHLFDTLIDSKMTISSLDICMDNPLYLVDHLPSVEKYLAFHYAHLSPHDFETFVKAASQQSKCIKFCNSDVPDKLEKLLGINAEGNVEVVRTEDDEIVISKKVMGNPS